MADINVRLHKFELYGYAILITLALIQVLVWGTNLVPDESERVGYSIISFACLIGIGMAFITRGRAERKIGRF